MAIPENRISTILQEAPYFSPDDLARESLTDYEQGGFDLLDTTQDMSFQRWTLTYNDPNVTVTAENSNGGLLFSLPGITELSLAFDQNMNPFVTYVVGGQAWYWWFNPQLTQQEHVQMQSSVLNPRCCLDDKRIGQVSASDIILAYVLNNNLYYREQRDRFEIEYLLQAGVSNLYSVGMGEHLRLQFSYFS